MAMTIESTTTEVLDLSTFIEDVDRRLNPEDDDSLAACASQLKALANNRKFITEELNHQLSGWHRFQSTNSYTAQTMMLRRQKKLSGPRQHMDTAFVTTGASSCRRTAVFL